MSEDRMDVDSFHGDEVVEHSHSGDGCATKVKPRFEVKKWTAVAFWSWDMQIENCAICRNHLMEPCIECQPNAINSNQEQCMAAWGQCNHAFHLHCISRWLKTRQACPLDNTEWVTQKVGS